MRIRFLEIGEIELDEAIQYYNYEAAGMRQPGLAMIFLPKSWDRSVGSIRKSLAVVACGLSAC